MQELNATPVLFNIPEVDDNSVTTKTSLLNGVIAAYNASGNRGNFKLIQCGDYLHVVPTSVLGANGTVQSFQPLLDTPVTFPSKQYSVGIVVSIVMNQVAQTRHIPILEATIPNNLFAQAVVTGGRMRFRLGMYWRASRAKSINSQLGRICTRAPSG